MWLGQTVTDSSWEPESKLPATLVKEYEDGIEREIIEHRYSSGGQVVTTITSELQDSAEVSEIKKPRLTAKAVESASSG